MPAQTKLKTVQETQSHPVFEGWGTFAQGDVPEWLKNLRHKAFADIQQTGLPTPKWERFKYTNLPAFLKKADLSYAAADITPEGNLSNVETGSKDFPDWAEEMLLMPPPGQDKYEDMALWQASSAFLRESVRIDIPDKETSKEPLSLTTIGHEGQFITPRIQARCGEQAQFTLIDRHQGQGTYWNNRITQIHVKAGAIFRHYQLQENSPQAAYTHTTHIVLEKGAVYEGFTLTNGAGISRHQIHVELAGEGAECTLNGVNMLSGTQVADTTITIEHQAPNCQSHQNYRSVLDGQATGIFQGKVHVHQIAQKTDGYQKSDTLLLSDSAQMNTKPELEIYADDVKCSHGTTTGKLEDTPLFYLRSRGIPEEEAKNMLILSFVGEIVDQIVDENIQTQVREKIETWLLASR